MLLPIIRNTNWWAIGIYGPKKRLNGSKYLIANHERSTDHKVTAHQLYTHLKTCYTHLQLTLRQPKLLARPEKLSTSESLMTSREMEKQRFASQIADYLSDRGLVSLALTGLEVGRPLAFMGGQLLWILQPTAGLLFPRQRIAQLATFLEDPEAVNQLVRNLSERIEVEVGQS